MTTRIDLMTGYETIKADEGRQKREAKMANEPQHTCEIFSRPEEKEALREFAHWLSNGGMASLRDMQQTANDYKRVRDIGFGMIVKAVWGAVLLALGLGGLALIKRYGE